MMTSIEKINEMLVEHQSIARVEKILGYGKDTLRKKLNKKGYKFNRETKQYETTEEVQQVEPVPKKDIVQVVTGSYTPKIYDHEPQFSEKQLGILHRIIKEYELKERIALVDEDKGELGNRNVRVYVDHFNKFSNWCKGQGITQADALHEAISMLMKKYQ